MLLPTDLNNPGEVFSVQEVIGFKENLPQTTLTDGVILCVELVESVKSVAILEKKEKSAVKSMSGPKGIIVETAEYFRQKTRMKSAPYRVNIKHIYGEIVSCKVH